MTMRLARREGVHARALRLLAAAAAAALAMAIPLSAAPSAVAVASTGSSGGSARTIVGPVSGDHAYNPKTGSQYAKAPSVTVDQTADLTDQVVHVTWQNFTPSYDPAGSFFNAGDTDYAVTVLQCKGTDPTDRVYSWPDFGKDCYNFTPSDDNATDGVGNQAYTLTGANGAGETYFHVETRNENNALGCDATHPCSLVVVPNWGGEQPSGEPLSAADVDCRAHDGDLSFFGHYALDNSLGNACSWADRFVIPLHFAPTPASCPAKDYQFAAEGAPMLARTMQQWQAGWCSGAHGLTFDYNGGTNEYLARQSFLQGAGALTSTTDVAVVNQPSSVRSKRFTYAPVANLGIAIAYHIDDERTGRLITNLTLDARLVAKLLTQSYSLDFGCTDGSPTNAQSATCDPAVKGNPADIFDDPEFYKLNPEYTRADFPSVANLNRGQFMPLVLSGDSDMTYQLTRWIESDASARAFVQGSPDPWKMHVNTYYRNEPMPTSQFQVLDPGFTAPASNGVPGQSTMQVSWNPISGTDNVAQSLVIDRPSGINPTLPACGGTGGVPCVYARFGSEPPGNRALFAVVGTPDAAADRFPAAKLVNAGGASVAPTRAGLAAGVAGSTRNKDGITRSTDYASRNRSQYPLTLTDYAMLPACGLPRGKAEAIQNFLNRITTSQRYGADPGELAAGDLRLTRAQLRQVRVASRAVTTDSCTTPPVVAPHRTHHPSTTHTSKHHSNSTTSGTGDPPPPSVTSTPKAKKTRTSKQHVTTSAPADKHLTAFGVKRADSGADFGIVLPLFLLLLTLLLVGGPGVLVWRRTTAGAATFARVHRLVRR